MYVVRRPGDRDANVQPESTSFDRESVDVETELDRRPNHTRAIDDVQQDQIQLRGRRPRAR
eukprot:9092306-Lingulodinium_polyedra.AAC.1